MVDDSPDPEESYLTKEVEHEVRLAMKPLEPCIGKIGWDILKKRTTQQDPVTLKELGAALGDLGLSVYVAAGTPDPSAAPADASTRSDTSSGSSPRAERGHV